MTTGKPKKVLSGLLDLALTMGACTQCRDNTVSMAGFQRGFKVALIISAKSSNLENTLFWEPWRNRLTKVVSVKDIHVFDGPHASAISSSLSVRFGICICDSIGMEYFFCFILNETIQVWGYTSAWLQHRRKANNENFHQNSTIWGTYISIISCYCILTQSNIPSITGLGFYHHEIYTSHKWSSRWCCIRPDLMFGLK